jgi:benzodiazapine receptor
MYRMLTYILPPLFYIGVALAGSAFTAGGMDGWYQSTAKPEFTPPGSVIGAVWTVIYILSAVSLILFLRSAAGRPALLSVASLFVLNGVMNAGWCWLFFTRHLLLPAVIDSALIALTVAAMIIAVRPYSRASAILLVPYLSWVSFATYLSFDIYRLNTGG